MSTLTAIRRTLRNALATVSGLEAYDYTPPQVNVPAAVVAPDGIEYDSTFEETATYRLPVQLLVSLGDWESAQHQLDDFCSHDGTVVQAINGSGEARVVAMSDYGLTAYGDKNYLGAVLTVEWFT